MPFKDRLFNSSNKKFKNEEILKQNYSANLKYDYLNDIWQEYYGNTESVTKINENKSINTENSNILVSNVLFQGKYQDNIIYLRNCQSLFAYTIFDNNQNDDTTKMNIYQESGSCVQYQICVKNAYAKSDIGAAHSYINAYGNNNLINYIKDSTIANSRGETKLFDLKNGLILIENTNISNTISRETGTDLIFYIYYGFQASISFSAFMNNTMEMASKCFSFYLSQSEYLHHLIIHSNTIYYDKDNSNILNGLFYLENSRIKLSECNIINNKAKCLILAYAGSLTISNCYFDRNTINKIGQSIDVDAQAIINNDNVMVNESIASEEIDIINSFPGDDICRSESLFNHELIMTNISIENENYSIIEFDENIQVRVYFERLQTISNIEIESWIDDEIDHITQNENLQSNTNFIVFEHASQGIFGSHTLHIQLHSRNKESDVISIDFTRRKKAKITVIDSFYTESKLVLSGIIDESYDYEYKHCGMHLSFYNITNAKTISVFRDEFDLISSFPENFDFRMNPVLIWMTNRVDKVIGETYHKVSHNKGLKLNPCTKSFTQLTLRRNLMANVAIFAFVKKS